MREERARSWEFSYRVGWDMRRKFRGQKYGNSKNDGAENQRPEQAATLVQNREERIASPTGTVPYRSRARYLDISDVAGFG